MTRHLLACILVVMAGPTTSAADDAPEPRMLFIAMDAVPFEVVERITSAERGEAALFRGYSGPVPLISTFPSTSSLAFGGIFEPLGLGLSPGYEARFFDRERNRVRGGSVISYHTIKFPWRELWDWKLGFFKKMFIGAHPKGASRKSIERSLAAFADSDKKRFFVYYDATDILGHLAGPDALEGPFELLDRTLRELHESQPERPFHTVLFSDHGQAGDQPLANVCKAVLRTLKEAGYQPAGSLHGGRDVVFVPYGLVSSFVAATRRGREVEVARVIVRTEGVDLCAAVDGADFRVVSARGAARIRRRRELWSYQPLDGDPLGLAPALAAARQEDGEAEVWRPDDWWLEATLATPYPDALYRIARGFDSVENPASILCAVTDAHMFGSGLTAVLAKAKGALHWTHGALERRASYGFVMSDVPGWQPQRPQRFNRALAPFRSHASTTHSLQVP